MKNQIDFQKFTIKISIIYQIDFQKFIPVSADKNINFEEPD